jgi:hypothetical protein
MAIGFEEYVQNKRCFLCKRGAASAYRNDGYYVQCKTCGDYHIGRTMLATIKEDELKLLTYLSVHARQAHERGELVDLNSINWKELARAHQNTPLSYKVVKLLELTGKRSKAGATAKFDIISDPPLVNAVDSQELTYLFTHLTELGYLEHRGNGLYLMKVKGWEQIQGPTVNGIPGRCFVAMSFDNSLKDAYQNGIFLALKGDCKMEPIRLDFVQHNEKICDKIIAEIRTCQFLVADVTLASQNVYFEAGFAMALKRPVIWLCKTDRFDQDVRFDTRQYPYIRWNTPIDLRSQLTDRIKATISDAV